jgi:hypothetical protein
MATDVATVKARLQDERAAVVAELAAIDLGAEQTLFAAAEATLAAAQTIFNKKSERWTFVMEKQERLQVLDAQIALFP